MREPKRGLERPVKVLPIRGLDPANPRLVASALGALLALSSARALADAPPPSPPGPPSAVEPDDPRKPPPPPPDPAKVAAAKLAELVKKGTESCAAGDVDDGLFALRAAWATREDPDLAVSLAACEIKAQEWPSAADHLAYALRNKDDPEQRKALEASFLNVRARVGAVKVTVSIDGADVFAGDRFVGTTPLPGEVFVAPGKSRISAKKTGYGEIEGTVEVGPQGATTLALDLANEGAIASSHRFPPQRSRTPAIVLGALGLVTAGVGAALYAAGSAKGSAADSLLSELQTVSSQPCVGAGAAGCQTLLSLRQGHDTLVNAGTGVLAASGGLLGATLIYALWATAAPATATGSISGPQKGVGSIRFAPVASTKGGSFVLQGAF